MSTEWAASIIIVVVVAVTLLARRLQVADPILLVVAGAGLAVMPGLPDVVVDPELILLVVLPPLLFWHAFIVSPREIRANAAAVGLLAVVLVALTAAAVAAGLHFALGVPWAVAVVIGAILGPTDPVAFLTVARRLGVSPRLVGLLDGENLLNDFTALVIYGVAVQAVMTGAFSAPEATIVFFTTATAGVAIGAVVGVLVSFVNNRVRHPLVPPIITLAGAYLSFLPAEALHVSAILAAGVAGRLAGARSSVVDRPQARLIGYGFWNTWIFLLTAALFVLLGLQLPVALTTDDIGNRALWACLAVIGIVVATRVVFVLGVTLLIPPIARRMTIGGRRWPWADSLVAGWSGMRGAISLVMVLTLPTDFPLRDLAIVITFAVIFATLLIQGLSLPILIRRLPVERDSFSESELERARDETEAAAMRELDNARAENALAAEQAESIRSGYRLRIDKQARDVELQMVDAERRAAISLRRAGEISDDVLREIEAELDMRAMILRRGELPLL